MKSRTAFAWIAGIVLGLAAVPAAPAQNGDPEDSKLVLPKEEGAVVAMRQTLEAIGSGVTAGQALDSIPAYKNLDPDAGKTLDHIHQILMTLATPESQKVAAVLVLDSWKRQDSVYPLLLVMTDHSEDYRVRYEIARRIAAFEDDRAIIPLCDILKSKETRFHSAAARSLASFGENERTQRNFRYLIVHADPSTRGWTARSIAWSGWEGGGDLLLTACDRERDPNAMANIFMALAESNVERGIDPIVRQLKNPNERVRGKAVEALGTFGVSAREKGLSGVLARLQDDGEKEGVRGTAGWVLWMIAPDSDEAGKALVAHLGHESQTIDDSCRTAIQYMQSKAMVDDLIKILASPDEIERRKISATNALRALIGRNLGDKPGPWIAWWETSRERFDFPRGRAVEKKD